MRVAVQPICSRDEDTIEVCSVPGDLFHKLFAAVAEARIAMSQDAEAAIRCLDNLESLLTLTRTDATADEQNPAVGGLAPWQIVRVRRHIDENLAGCLSTAELSGLVCLSENHFSRAFKASLGCTPHSYVLQCRVARAKQLMVSSLEPLSQIALLCGFSDQSHLSRLFRRLTGISPSAWRRRHRVVDLRGEPLVGAAPAPT